MPSKEEQVRDGALVKNVTKFSSMQRVYGNLVERVFDIDAAQYGVGNHAMALAEVYNPFANIPEDVTKFTRGNQYRHSHSNDTHLLQTSSHG